MSEILRKQFEEETGLIAQIDGSYNRTYTQWLEDELKQRLEAGQHETIVNCTPSEKAIEIAGMQDTFDNKILMVLSSHITHGSSEGALVSAKEFDQILQDMKYLFNRCN